MRPAPGVGAAFAVAVMTLFLAAFLAACGPLGKPFQPETKSLGGLPSPRLSDKFGVFVAGIDNAPAPANEALSEAIISALGATGIPASRSSANRGSYMLVGRSLWRPAAAPSGQAAVEIAWRVIDADGEAIAVMGHRAYADEDRWAEGDPDVMRAIAEDLALQLGDLLGGADTLPTSAPESAVGPPSYPSVSIAEIDSAPGDGGTSLAAAMRRALRGRGIPVVEGGDSERVVRCTVEIARAGGRERVSIRWTLLDARGIELGSVEQDNTLIPGSLDGAWGPIANAIADAAAGGLIDLFDETRNGVPGAAPSAMPGATPVGLQPSGALLQSAPNPSK